MSPLNSSILITASFELHRWRLTKNLRLLNSVWNQILSVELDLPGIALQSPQLVEEGIVSLILGLEDSQQLVLFLFVGPRQLFPGLPPETVSLGGCTAFIGTDEQVPVLALSSLNSLIQLGPLHLQFDVLLLEHPQLVV